MIPGIRHRALEVYYYYYYYYSSAVVQQIQKYVQNKLMKVEEKGRIHSKCSNIIKIATSCLLSVYIQGSSDQEIDRVPLTPLKVSTVWQGENKLFFRESHIFPGLVVF